MNCFALWAESVYQISFCILRFVSIYVFRSCVRANVDCQCGHVATKKPRIFVKNRLDHAGNKNK